MSSVVCQGLRSCLKPRLIEPIVLRHKLTPPIPLPQHHHLEENSHETNHMDDEEDHNIDHPTNKVINKKDDLGGWSFLNNLTNPSQISKQVSEKPYVHPMVRSFASQLSSKSLEMCTESLGCETGSNICESNEEFGSISWEQERLIAMRNARQFSKKVVATSSSFPPPLTSISGSDGVRVKPHREGGRLVIKAVSVSSCGTNFQAERSNGRLKLSLVKNDCSMKCQFEMAAKIEEEEEEEEAAAAAAAAYIDEEEDNEDDVDNHEDDNNCQEEEGYCVRDMEGNVGKVEGGIGIGEISRPSRCKEGEHGNKGIPNWGSFWVAI